MYKQFDDFIADDFAIWICVQNPYHELAERLLFLSSVRKVGMELLGDRDRVSMADVMEFAESAPLRDPRALKRALRALPREIALKLSNPLTRQLACTEVDEMPSGGAVASALDVLARCELVGRRTEVDQVAVGAVRLLDLPLEHTPPSTPLLPSVNEVAEALVQSGAAATLLETDLELFYHLNTAEKAAQSDADE